MYRIHKGICPICKKLIPDTWTPIPDPCVCRDYREKFAREHKSMNPITYEAYMIKRAEYLKKWNTKSVEDKND